MILAGPSLDERMIRIRLLLAASRRLADATDPLGREARRLLPAATGLSPEGVELGLSRYLETAASDADLARLVERAGSAPRVHVALSANVFVGAVRALGFALATGGAVRVRASTREAVMAPLLLRALSEANAGLDVELCDALEPTAGDVVHVYGRRATIDAIVARTPPGARVVGRGPGFGVAVVDGTHGDRAREADQLSRDVVVFDQRGCLSPRLVLVHGSVEQATAFADGLARELERRGSEVPRGSLTEDERRDHTMFRQTASAIGRSYTGTTFALGLDTAPRALLLPPTGRCVHVARVTGQDDLARLLAPYREAITCVGHPPETRMAATLSKLSRGAREQPLGEMQSPPMDGPVDLRGML